MRALPSRLSVADFVFCWHYPERNVYALEHFFD